MREEGPVGGLDQQSKSLPRGGSHCLTGQTWPCGQFVIFQGKSEFCIFVKSVGFFLIGNEVKTIKITPWINR